MKKYIVPFCLALAFLIVSCEEEPVVESTPDTPHTWSDWFSTDLESDSIILFVSDIARQFQIKCSIEGITVVNDDEFVAKLYNPSSSSISVGSSYSYTGHFSIAPVRVGRTNLHVSAQNHNTDIKVVILGEHYTYTEPGIDFDDTEDSVRSKLIKTFSYYAYNSADQYYQVGDSRGKYNLYINYSNNGMIDNYVVDLYQGESAEEITGFISERYYKTSAYSNGLPVYIKAYNLANPSISDASIVIIPNPTHHKVTYKNPATYGTK